MNALSKAFLTGLAAVVPIAITLYILYWLGSSAEHILGVALRWALPEAYYWPGLGLLAGIALVSLTGFLLQAWVFQRLFAWFDRLLARLPVVRTLYNSIRDLTQFFSTTKSQEFNQVVAVSLPNSDIRLLGFITREDVAQVDSGLGSADTVAVYLPLSYQIGGYTVFLPRACVQAIDMPMQEAMRFTLTAGITSTSTISKNSTPP